MEDIWGEKYGIDRVDSLACKGVSFDAVENISQLNMQSAIPTMSSSSTTTSTKTHSEYTESTSPSLLSHNDSPTIGNPALPSTQFNSQPTDSIAQMLKCMRACNNSQMYQEHSSDYVEEEESSYRKRGRLHDQKSIEDAIDAHREQQLSSNNVKRSKSQGSEVILMHLRKETESKDRRVRPRSKTSVELWRRNNDYRANAITSSIDHQEHRGSIKSATPSRPNFNHEQSEHNTLNRNASRSNTTNNLESASSFPSIAPLSSRNDSSQNRNSNNLSFAEFLQSPEGAAWTQHFREKYSTLQIDEGNTSGQVQMIKVKEEDSQSVMSPQQPTSDESPMVKMNIKSVISDKAEEKRNRNLSLTDQLDGTYITKSIEEGRSEKSDLQTDAKGLQDKIKGEAKRAKKNSKGNKELVIAPKTRFSKTRRTKSRPSVDTSPMIPSLNKSIKVEKEGSNKLTDRRRRRRESHNAVERRRRDHINEKIAELASLLPESMLVDAIAASTGGGTTPHIDLSLFKRRPAAEEAFLGCSPNTTSNETILEEKESRNDIERKANALAPVHSSSETLALAQSKPNKGIILSKSVDYIKHLHEFCSILRHKQIQIQSELDRFKLLKQTELEISSKGEIRDQQIKENFAINDATPTPDLSAWLDQYRN